MCALARLYLVRHARTPLNADGRLWGNLDPALDDVGRTEAVDLASTLLSLLTALDPALGPADSLGQRTSCWNVLSWVDRRWRVERVDEKAAR